MGVMVVLHRRGTSVGDVAVGVVLTVGVVAVGVVLTVGVVAVGVVAFGDPLLES